MKKWLIISLALLAVALAVTGCSLPFRKPLPGPTPPLKDPIPGPAEKNPGSALTQEPGKFYRTGDPKKRTIALTFDDGPEPVWTPKILDILKQKKIKATFFVIGKEMDKYPDIARRMAAEGHILANHTYNHVNLNNVPPEIMVSEIEQGAAAVAKITRQKPKLLRPPFGAQNPAVIQTANDAGSFVILWSVDTEDWRGLSASTVRARVVPTAKNGDIILQHNGEGPDLNGTIGALPMIIDELKARGYTFVTIPELLNIPAYEGSSIPRQIE